MVRFLAGSGSGLGARLSAMNKAGLGELELAIMDLIWSQGRPVTVPEVHRQMAAKRGLAYTTTMTVMSRLSSKGLLQRTEDRRPYTYSVAIGRDEYYAQLMVGVLSEVLDRQAALAKFVERIDRRDADLLMKLIGEAKTKSSG